jgi:hypothetical protein
VIGEVWGLELSGAGAIAQIAVAAIAAAALLAAGWQVRVARTTARRERAYKYSDRISEKRTILLIERYKRYWESTNMAAHMARSYASQTEWRALANWIEEVAAMYTRNLVDRDVIAETMGIYIEELWKASEGFINERRTSGDRPQPELFTDWQWMQEDTRGRRKRYRKRARKRRELREDLGLRPFR